MIVKLFFHCKLSSPNNINILSISLFIFLVSFSQSAYSQNFGSGYYRLTSKWLRETKSLDVVNDSAKDKLQLAKSGNQSGQSWKITSVGSGYYRLTTEWLGETKSLDVVSDGAKDKLQLAKSGNISGQFWKISHVGDGYYRLTTKWLGETKSLDVVNDGAKDKLQLAKSGDYSGQLWKISAISSDTANDGLDDETPLRTEEIELHGFRIIINSKIAESDETQTALDLLSESLEELTRVVKPKQLKLLKQVPIWLEIKHTADGSSVWYHKSREWLSKNGYPAEAVKSVEIKNVEKFVQALQSNQPYVILHELAHAYHDLHLTAMREKIRAAYNSAVSSGKYDNVPRKLSVITGRAYAMNNEDEYFAELTEAYLGTNDYYPYKRQELKELDPLGYRIMQEAWD